MAMAKITPSFRKTYDEKPNAIEHDFYIVVYFDEDHVVFHKYFGEYIK